MRTSIGSVLLSGILVLVALAFGTSRPVAAQTLGVGNCLGATEADFSPGLGSTLSNQQLTIGAIFYGCNFLTNPAPVSFTWSGTIVNAGCLAISTQVPTGTGQLKWENGQTSTLAFTSLTYAGAIGVVPAVLTFTVVNGYKQGGQFQATAALAPSLYQVTCSNSQPVTVLTGAVPTVTFNNVGL